MTRRVNSFTIALTLAISSLSACKSGPLDQISELKEEMCDCEDLECAQGVEKKFNELKASLNKDEIKGEEKAKAGTIMQEFLACRLKHQPAAQ